MRKVILLLCLLCPTLALADATPDTESARKACTDAMNADPMFANSIIKIANEQTAAAHMKAAENVAKNERHVILAYAAMWVVAAGFVIFLWRRQQGLKLEIETLRRDLAAATKDTK